MLDAVAAIAAEAGQLALARIGGDYSRWDKAPGHPVCDVDLAVDAFLRERLGRLDPDAAWLSEESADDGARLSRRRVWIVDPIDGTRDYLRRRSGWCVSAALVEDGAPVVAVLSAPARDELWTAARGQGARCNGTSLRVADRGDLRGARVPIDVLPARDGDLVAVSKPNSIALRIAMVARGDADLVAATRRSREWDVAAAMLIAQEAGAAASTACGAALRFNTATAQIAGLVVSAPRIHGAAVARFGSERTA